MPDWGKQDVGWVQRALARWERAMRENLVGLRAGESKLLDGMGVFAWEAANLTWALRGADAAAEVSRYVRWGGQAATGAIVTYALPDRGSVELRVYDELLAFGPQRYPPGSVYDSWNTAFDLAATARQHAVLDALCAVSPKVVEHPSARMNEYVLHLAYARRSLWTGDGRAQAHLAKAMEATAPERLIDPADYDRVVDEAVPSILIFAALFAHDTATFRSRLLAEADLRLASRRAFPRGALGYLSAELLMLASFAHDSNRLPVPVDHPIVPGFLVRGDPAQLL